WVSGVNCRAGAAIKRAAIDKNVPAAVTTNVAERYRRERLALSPAPIGRAASVAHHRGRTSVWLPPRPQTDLPLPRFVEGPLSRAAIQRLKPGLCQAAGRGA